MGTSGSSSFLFLALCRRFLLTALCALAEAALELGWIDTQIANYIIICIIYYKSPKLQEN